MNFRSKPDPSPTYPTFLLPSLKIPFFRRRQSSVATTASALSNDPPSLSSSPISTTSADVSPSSPTAISADGIETYTDQLPLDKPTSTSKITARPFPARDTYQPRLVSPHPDVLRCSTCGTDLAYGLQVVSKGFTGRHGRALLVGPPLATSTPSCPGSLAKATARTPAADDIAPGHHALAHASTNLVNVTVSSPESRNLVTGAHVVADIRCATCGVAIGWKYVDAREQTQKYKVGKFILELERTVLVRNWEDQGGEVQDRHFYSSSAPAESGGRRKSRSLPPGGIRKDSTSSKELGGVGAFPMEEEEEREDSESDGEISFDSEDEDECEDIFAGAWDAATVARRRASLPSGSGRRNKKARAARAR